MTAPAGRDSEPNSARGVSDPSNPSDEGTADVGVRPRRVVRGVWEQISTIVLAVFIAFSIRTVVVEPFRIPSGSMFPTLLIGDHLFVNKFVYGARVPFTDFRLPGLRDPERGEVVVFTVAQSGRDTFPADERPDLPREEFVKRIVGLPGERIEVRDAVVLVDGRPIDSTQSGESFIDDKGRELDVYDVTLPDRHFRTLDDPRRGGPPPAVFDVPPGRYFVLGDNRDHSKDSRSWGTVRRQEIRGPVFVLYWSWAWDGAWLELANPLTWWDLMTQRMRWDRVGTRIE